MKLTILYLLPVVIISLLVTPCHSALEAPPKTTLPERVDKATDILLGTIKKIRFFRLVRNGKDSEEVDLHPAPEELESLDRIKFEIEVDQLLYVSSPQVKDVITYIIHILPDTNVSKIREDYMEKQFIFVTREATPKSNRFLPVDFWHPNPEALDKEAEILDLIQRRVQRETD